MIAVMADEGEDWKEIAATPIQNADAGSSSEPPAAAASSQPTGGNTPGVDVNMPSLSPTMQEGTIVKWMVKEGDKINPGDVICDIQTDKAVVSMDWDDEAIMAKILVQEGEETVAVR